MLSEVHQDAERSRRRTDAVPGRLWQSQSMYGAHRRLVGDRGGEGGWETAVNPGGRWLLSPMKIHVSPFSVRQLGSASTRSRRDCGGAAASPQLSLPAAQTRLSPHEYVDRLTAQRLGGTSHYEGSTFDREENLTPCLPTRLDLRTVLFPPDYC